MSLSNLQLDYDHQEQPEPGRELGDLLMWVEQSFDDVFASGEWRLAVERFEEVFDAVSLQDEKVLAEFVRALLLNKAGLD